MYEYIVELQGSATAIDYSSSTYIVHSLVPCTMYYVPRTMYIVQGIAATLYDLCTSRSSYCVQVLCTLYDVLCTMYIVPVQGCTWLVLTTTLYVRCTCTYVHRIHRTYIYVDTQVVELAVV